VSIYSEIGNGTTVKMYFPRVHRDAVTKSERIHSAEIQERGNGERIFVVEDDAQVRSFVAETLAGLNYEVAQASTGEEALRILESGLLLDVLLTDVILPGMNGRELAGAVQKTRPTVKVLFMTGYSRNAIVHHGRLDAGVMLLQKPFSVEELSVRIRQALASRPGFPAQTAAEL
jgi:CheY-like chemotaxis protein